LVKDKWFKKNFKADLLSSAAITKNGGGDSGNTS